MNAIEYLYCVKAHTKIELFRKNKLNCIQTNDNIHAAQIQTVNWST